MGPEVDPQHPRRKLGRVAHSCHHRAGEADRQIPWDSLAKQSNLISDPQVPVRSPVSKTKMAKVDF